MLPKLSKIKGIHPGVILQREMKNRGIRVVQLAQSSEEHKQTISAILNKRRKITPKLSIKLSELFNVDSDYFMLLQASYDVNTLADKLDNDVKPNLSKFRHVLFWDTDFEKIDWQKQRHAIIKRVLERGNDDEINELIRFYGRKTISAEINHLTPRLSSMNRNIIKYKL